MPSPRPNHRSVIDAATCVLHIGTPKTGSTAIECFLSENRARLQERGFIYPASIERGYAHHDLAFLASGGYPEWAKSQDRSLAQLLDAVQAEAADSPTAGKLLLSSENFYWLADPQAVCELLATLGHRPQQTAVVVYLRSQEQAMESWYNQLVKAMGYSGTFTDSINEFDALWDYARHLERWAAVFGHAQIIVRTYPDTVATNFDIRHDFATLLGIEPDTFRLSASRPNERLLRDVLEFQRIINRLPLPTVEKRRYHKQLIALSSAAGGELLQDAPLLGTTMRQRIRQRYAAGNAAVAQHYGDGNELFRLPPLDAAPGSDGDDTITLGSDKLVFLLTWLLMQQSPPSEAVTTCSHGAMKQ